MVCIGFVLTRPFPDIPSFDILITSSVKPRWELVCNVQIQTFNLARVRQQKWQSWASVQGLQLMLNVLGSSALERLSLGTGGRVDEVMKLVKLRVIPAGGWAGTSACLCKHMAGRM